MHWKTQGVLIAFCFFHHKLDCSGANRVPSTGTLPSGFKMIFKQTNSLKYEGCKILYSLHNCTKFRFCIEVIVYQRFISSTEFFVAFKCQLVQLVKRVSIENNFIETARLALHMPQCLQYRSWLSNPQRRRRHFP